VERAAGAEEDTAKTLSRITVDPTIMQGKPCVRRMRIPVSLVVKLVAHGISADGILAECPDLVPHDIRECLQYAACLTDERVVRFDEGTGAVSGRYGYRSIRGDRFSVSRSRRIHLSEEGRQRLPDSAVVEEARAEHRVILAHDLDYPRLVTISEGAEPSIIDFRPAS